MRHFQGPNKANNVILVALIPIKKALKLPSMTYKIQHSTFKNYFLPWQHLYRDKIFELLSDHSASNASKPLFLYVGFQTPHTPHQVPEEYEDLYPDLMLPMFKTYNAMITAMDEAIGEVVSKLKEVGLYENTIIAMLGDNGAPVQMFNSNSPFRGSKGSDYEGGTRTAAFIHSPLLKQQG